MKPYCLTALIAIALAACGPTQDEPEEFDNPCKGPEAETECTQPEDTP
jgi:hypothetical protein